MLDLRGVPPQIHAFGEECSEGLALLKGEEAQAAFVSDRLPQLLSQKELFQGILRGLLEGADYPDVAQSTMFDNEMLLYGDNRRLFTIRLFVWGPGDYTPVHDHNAWGVIGPVTGRLDVVKYRREDDGSGEEAARLLEDERLILKPAETTVTFTGDRGIHKTGNADKGTMVSLSLYGRPTVPKPYIHGFEPESGRIYRIEAPRVHKKRLVKAALREPAVPGWHA